MTTVVFSCHWLMVEHTFVFTVNSCPTSYFDSGFVELVKCFHHEASLTGCTGDVMVGMFVSYVLMNPASLYYTLEQLQQLLSTKYQVTSCLYCCIFIASSYYCNEFLLEHLRIIGTSLKVTCTITSYGEHWESSYESL